MCECKVDSEDTNSARDLNDIQSSWFTPRLGRKMENEPEVTLGDLLNEYPVWFLPLPYKGTLLHFLTEFQSLIGTFFRKEN